MAFNSQLAAHLNRYVDLKRALGLQFHKQSLILQTFDLFLIETRCDLNEQAVLQFAGAQTHITKREKATRYHVVRHFFDYLSAFRDVPVLSPKAMRWTHRRPPPYVFTRETLMGLLAAVRQSVSDEYCRVYYRTMIGLAVSCGLRIGEVTRLDVSDVDFAAGFLRVRRTKFRKNRLVPFHTTTGVALRSYAAARDSKFGRPECLAFFVNIHGRHCKAATLARRFVTFAEKAGLRPRVGRQPTFHSLRHTFAVWRLIAWYEDGRDPQQMLPFLATFMGHVSYESTAYYLSATSEVLGLAAARLEDFARREES